MIDLKEFNKKIITGFNNPMKPVKNNITCPDCNNELLDSNPSVTLASLPPQKNVHCESCGYHGYRYC